MKDRRYSTAAWRKLRRQVLAYAGGVCQIQGPRCTGAATTVDHIVPVSQWPEGFWEPENLRRVPALQIWRRRPGCSPEHEATDRGSPRCVVAQQQQIEEMAERLAAYENGEPERPRVSPRIY